MVPVPCGLKRQRQVYIRQADRSAVRRGLSQYGELLKAVEQLTDLNVQLLRIGRLVAKTKAAVGREGRHG